MWFKELTRSPEFRGAAGAAVGTAVALSVSGILRTGWNKLMQIYPSQAIGGLVALVLLGLLFLCLFFLVRLIIARGWVTYFSLGLPPIAVGVTSLLWPPMKNALPWVVLGIAPVLVAWKVRARRTRTDVRIDTDQEEKREARLNALRNAALPNAPQEDAQLLFHSLIDSFTPGHLRMLKVVDSLPDTTAKEGISCAEAMRRAFPELVYQIEPYRQLIKDLSARGLLEEHDRLYPESDEHWWPPDIIDMGRQFLDFITEPIERYESQYPEPPPESIVLEDSLEELAGNARGYPDVQIQRGHNGMREIYDPKRKRKVVQIATTAGFVRYTKQLPTDQGTVTVCVKLPSSGDFFPGAFFEDGDDTDMPNFAIGIRAPDRPVFTYKPEGGDWVHADIRVAEPMVFEHWYEVSATWGPGGIKLQVLDIEAGGKLIITGQYPCREPINSRTLYFAIGAPCPDDDAAQNLLLSDLRVTNIQEF